MQKKMDSNKVITEEEKKKMWKRHRNHTGPRNITRGYCIYCEDNSVSKLID